MTLIDLLRLMRRYIILVVALPILFAAGAVGYTLLQNQAVSYSANAYVVAGTATQIAAINGTASSSAREYTAENQDYTASVKADSASLTVTIAVNGPDENEVVVAANEIADVAVKRATRLVIEEPVSANVQHASISTRLPGTPIRNYVIVAVLAGLFVAICAVVVIDAARRPVKGVTDLAKASGLRVLAELPDDTGERLLANVRFASAKSSPRTILVVPVRETDAADFVGTVINDAAQSESLEEAKQHGGMVNASACTSLLQGITAAYQAREADAIIVAAAQWDDSRKDVESTVNELLLAGANVAGCVLVKASYGTRRLF